MLMLLITTFGVAIVSALIPVINLETYIAVAAAITLKFGVWPISMAAAAGQAVGKLCWYTVGRSSINWKFVEKKMQTPKWKHQFAVVQAQADKRSWAGMAMLLLSATVGLPPLAIMAVIAGQLRFNRWWFYFTMFVGRTLRFAAVMGGMSWLARHGS